MKLKWACFLRITQRMKGECILANTCVWCWCRWITRSTSTIDDVFTDLFNRNMCHPEQPR
ncbi:hypothetical protein DAI22_12g134200 [Oryza sativa Japonica Group]|nr:hypothetical protein DAI22_12g134200 [Oryza sativa Japonica Group]